ncbi:MAG: ATPase [Clostridiales bacterium]|nr:MAG: ATPase [Clostridiales bacterium]
MYNKQVAQVIKQLNGDINDGLTAAEAAERLRQNGANALISKAAISPFKRFVNQFQDFMIWILIAAAIFSFFTHEVADGFIILAIVLLNGILGFVQENNAEKSMQALKNMQVPAAQVLREGRVQQVLSPEIVIGDIVLLNAGDVVPADGRLIEAAALRIEESQLTGESLPVDKHANVIQSEQLPLGDRRNMAYSTSRVAAGRAKMIVTATGMQTEIGKIAGMLDDQSDEKTALQIKLAELGKLLGIAAVVICLLIFVIGYLQGRDPYQMVLLAISLAVAAIPEGLPAIVTIVLAIGVQRMIKAHAIVRKLPAVETLGSASVICSDKTGTLTQNKMTVVELLSDTAKKTADLNSLTAHDRLLLKTAVYCNDGSVELVDGKIKQIGDPTETALLALALQYDITQQSLAGVRIAEVPFDSERKLMTTIIKQDGLTAYVKGAPDQLLARCTSYYQDGATLPLDDAKRQQITAAIAEKSARALRVLGYAIRRFDALPAKIDSASVENDLLFIGLTAMIDPPRPEVKAAIKDAHLAGVRTVMVTGDYKDTAVAIAQQLGIIGKGQQALSGIELDALTDEQFSKLADTVTVYARVNPSHKVRIDVSKEASDIILTDDNFTTIVAAIKEGRIIYDNIKKSINFLLSSNIGEIITLLLAIVLNLPAPLLAIHILWINLVTDSFPALALGVEQGEADIMRRKPRNPAQSILGDGLMRDIFWQGLLIAGLSLTAFWLGLRIDLMTAQTMTFLTLSFAQLVHSYNVRSRRQSLFKTGIFSNMRLNQGVIISLAAMLVVYLVPALRVIFKLKWLMLNELLITFTLSLLPFVAVEIYKAIWRQIKT